MKKIEEYSAMPNPWHAWIMDNAPAFADFIRYAAKIERLNADNRGRPWLVAIPEWLDNSGLDNEEALDAWVAYCNFRADLNEYRTPRARGVN